MGEILNNLEDSDQFIVTTDKTSIFRSVNMKKWLQWMNIYRSGKNKLIELLWEAYLINQESLWMELASNYQI